MTNQLQVELVKTFWEQSREAALYADECWRILMQSQKSILDSLQSVGCPIAVVTAQFDQFMEDHSRRYKAALQHMDKMANAYLETIQKTSG